MLISKTKYIWPKSMCTLHGMECTWQFQIEGEKHYSIVAFCSDVYPHFIGLHCINGKCNWTHDRVYANSVCCMHGSSSAFHLSVLNNRKKNIDWNCPMFYDTQCEFSCIYLCWKRLSHSTGIIKNARASAYTYENF